MTASWFDFLVRACGPGGEKELQAAMAAGLPLGDYLQLPLNDTFTALHYAVDKGAKPDVIKMLLHAGADINARTKLKDTKRPGLSAKSTHTPLMLAARRGNAPLVKLLLDAGADLHAEFINANGVATTALHMACRPLEPAEPQPVFQLLTAAGLKPDLQCLLHACANGTAGMVNNILAARVDVNDFSLANRWGTALHNAVDKNRDDIVAILLAAGANPSTTIPLDNQLFPGGISAIDLARKKKRTNLVALMEKRTAPSK